MIVLRMHYVKKYKLRKGGGVVGAKRKTSYNSSDIVEKARDYLASTQLATLCFWQDGS